MEYVGNIIYDEKLLKPNTKFVIYGLGKVGKEIYEFMDINDQIGSIHCFCDRNCELWGTEYKGIPVVCPDEIIKECPEYHYLTGGIFKDEIVRFLMKRGVRNIHILFLN